MDEVRQNKKQRELQEKLDSVRSSLDFVTRNNADMEDRMMEMMGPNAEGSEFLMQREIYTKGQYTPTKYDYGGTKLSSEEIALVNTAALCQPKSAMHGLRCSGKAEDTENVTSSFVFMYQDAMLTEELRKSIGPYIKATYNTARELGHDAIIAYNAGDPKPMAKILGDSIRQSNIYAINVAKFSSKATALVKNAERMMQLLEQDPALMENSGLDEAEMKRYRAVQVNSKLYQESLQAREALLLDAMGQQKLAPEEKQQYLATEALFRVVDGERARKSSETQESSPKYQQLEQEVIRLSIQTGQLRTEIEIAEKDPQQEAPEGKKRELMELEKQLDQRHAQLSEVGEITEPTETLNRMAENYEGVRQELTEHLLRQPKIQTLPEDLLDALNVLDSSENFRSLKAPVAERLEVLDTQRIEEYRQVSQIIAGDKKLKDASMDVYHTLGNLLKEDRTYIRSSDGKEFHICGSNKNPEKGTMGMLDVFAGPDYLDQPFSEVSRNMPSHFKMYCLSRGMTEDELCSLRKEPGPELKEKLLGWKDDFMQMVIDKDTDAISDMYVGICNMVEEDGARFRNVTAMCNLNETDPALLIKYSGKQNWMTQTLPRVGRSAKPGAVKLVAQINEKLQAAGKDYTFDSIGVPLDPLESIFQTGISKEELQKGSVEMMKVTQVEFMQRRTSVLPLQEMMSKPLPAGKSWLSNIVLGEEAQETYINLLGQYLGNGKPLEFIPEAIRRTKELKPAEIPVKPYRGAEQEATELSNLLNGNVRKNLFGGAKKNSDAYEAVRKAAEHAAAMEKQMEALRKAGMQPDEHALKAMKEAYQEMSSKAQSYLKARPNPRTEEGRERRAMIERCKELADRQCREAIRAEKQTAAIKQTEKNWPQPEKAPEPQKANEKTAVVWSMDDPCKLIQQLGKAAKNYLAENLKKPVPSHADAVEAMKLMVLADYLEHSESLKLKLKNSRDPLVAASSYLKVKPGSAFQKLTDAVKPEKDGDTLRYTEQSLAMMRSFVSGDGVRQTVRQCTDELRKGANKVFAQKKPENVPVQQEKKQISESVI